MFPELDSHSSYYNGHSFPYFEQPRILGFFSVNGMKEFVPDASQLKFARSLSVGPVNYDLNSRLSEAIQYMKDDSLMFILKFLLFNKNNIKPKIAKCLNEAKFVCFRSLLTSVASTPYENSSKSEPWRIIVTLFHGTIYMCERDTEDQAARIATEKEVRCSSWGCKFEQFVLSENPFLYPDVNEPCNENEGFGLVFQTRLNNHQLLYSAEMDGLRVDKSQGPITPPDKELGYGAMLDYLRKQHFVELKTMKRIENPYQEKNYRKFKAKKWWCQSFLAGVEDILCGVRNDDGIVEELKLFDVSILPNVCQKYWNKNVCFNFLDTFLSHVKKCLSLCIVSKYGEEALNNLENVGKITLRFEWAPGQSIRVTDNYDKEIDNIIPDWFERDYGDN